MKKRISFNINFTNRAIYTLITFSIFLLIGISVFALTPGVAPNPGHLIEEMAPPLNCETNQVLQWDGSTWICDIIDLGDSIPTGAIMAFNLSDCPSNWSKLTDAEGRYIVGMPQGGTLAATVGTALTDQEDRAVGHPHSHDTSGTNILSWTHQGAPSGGRVVTSVKEVTGAQDGTNAPYIQFLYCVKD